jgi:hypothetical protein
MRAIRSDLEELVFELEKRGGETPRDAAASRALLAELEAHLHYTRATSLMHEVGTSTGRTSSAATRMAQRATSEPLSEEGGASPIQTVGMAVPNSPCGSCSKP